MFDLFLCDNRNTYIFVKENHPESNIIKSNCAFMDIASALNFCDCIIIFYAVIISPSLIKKCKEVERTRHIPLHVVNEPKKPYGTKRMVNEILKTIRNVPSILILQVGISSQIERVENELYNFLMNENVVFSFYSNSLFSSICETIDKPINNGLSKKIPASVISIISITNDINDLITNDTDNFFFDIFLRKLRPDYTIICCENDFSSQCRLRQVFKIKYSIDVDAFFFSEYVSLKSNNEYDPPLFIRKVKKPNIERDIMLKLTQPKSTMRINL